MKNGRLLFSISFAAAALWYTGAVAIAAENEHAMKVGKTGDVTFAKETKVGDMTLQPGRYKFDHRIEGADHFVHFTEWAKPYPGVPTDDPKYPGGPKAHPGEVKCRLEMLSKKVSDTTIYTTAEGKGERVTKVEVAGENVAHLF